MKYTEMNHTKWYRVITGSECGTFQVGDRIRLIGDGDILCREAQGWVEASALPGCTVGMTVELDAEWTEKRRGQLLRELEELG